MIDVDSTPRRDAVEAGREMADKSTDAGAGVARGRGGLGIGVVASLAALMVAPCFAIRTFVPREWWLEAGVGAMVVSLVAMGFYAWDKRKARRQEWRIPEATLQLWALAGGWPGALLAQRLFRHKTSKFSFQAVFWAIVALHQYVAIDAVLGGRMARAMATALRSVLGR